MRRRIDNTEQNKLKITFLHIIHNTHYTLKIENRFRRARTIKARILNLDLLLYDLWTKHIMNNKKRYSNVRLCTVYFLQIYNIVILFTLYHFTFATHFWEGVRVLIRNLRKIFLRPFQILILCIYRLYKIQSTNTFVHSS